MKQKFYVFLILIIANISFSQNYNWITPNQAYLKMYVVDDGIYRINKIDFTNAGVNTGTIDPRTVKVYYKGNQVPVFFNGEQDGVFDDTDFFDFYGQRNYGGLTNAYNSGNNTESVVYTTYEYNDLYSDTSAYWVGWGGAYGTRFQSYNFTSFVPYPLDYFYKKLHFEKDLVYSLGENIDGNDTRYFNTERFQGEGWYWMQMQWGNTITQNFTSPYLSSTTQPCILKLFAYPQYQSGSYTNEHKLVITFNNNPLDTLTRNHFSRFDTTLYFPSTYLNPSSNNIAKVKYNPLDANVWLNFDMFEISYPRRFEFDTNKVSFSTGSSDSTSKIYKIKGFNTSNPTNIYDVKYGYRITNYYLSADTLVFTGKGDGVFEVLNKYITKKPFRIKQRQVPALASASNGADYLVIYNKLFETQAEQLRAYRNSHDGFRSVRAEMEDIYDIFNYGIENPAAIRNFVKYIYTNWTLPRISYVCLLGRGSLDPKKNSSASVFYQNYIPVFGNPPSDGYYANFNTGTFSYCQQIGLGRLPAYTVQEAQDMVNKIITYESLPLDSWVKKSTFISGGNYFSDQQQLISQLNTYVNTNIIVPPLSMEATKICLNDPTGTVTYNYSDSIKNTINRGAFFVSYIGHSSSAYWDFAFSDPGVLSNGNKMPLVFSMTCFTGRNAETNARGYGEKFITSQGKGAIGFISTTGWSYFPAGGNVFEQFFLNGLSTDSLRRVGDLMKFASTTMAPESLYFAERNTINCYNLLGDPAVKLLLPKYPEFDIQLSDYALSNPYPVVRENISLKIFPKNLGTFADSCKIRFQVLKNNQNHGIKDTVVHNWAFVDTVVYNFKLDTVGIYSMKIILDVDNRFPQELTTNNSIAFPLNVKNSSFVPIKPIDNMIVKSDTVEFVGINPNINTSSNSVRLIVQMDTSKTFTSGMSQTNFTNTMTGAATKFRIRIPVLDSNMVYFWRLNAIVNNTDTLGWSEVRRFKYNITLPPSFTSKGNTANLTDKVNSVKLTDANYASLPADSNITIYKNKFGQYNDYELSGIGGDNSGLRTVNFTGNLIASSWGGDPWEPTYYVVNNSAQSLTRQNIDWNGIFLVKINKASGNIISKLHIYLTSAASSDSVLAFLNTFDSTNILMSLKLINTGFAAYNLNANTKNKFRQFGSTKIDTLDFTNWNWDRWNFISYPNNPNPVVLEVFGNTDWIPSVSTMQPTFRYLKGSVSQVFGPAKTWKNFSWQQTLFQGTTVKFDVYGIDRFNVESLLMPNVSTNSYVDLQSINSYTYPKLKLVAKLNIDSLTGTQSPVLQSLKFNYVAPSELAIDYNTFIKSDSLLNGGDSLGIALAYYNVGYVDLYGYTKEIYSYDNNGQKVVLKTETNSGTLKIDSVNYVKTNVRLAGLPNLKKFNNYIVLYVEATPLVYQNDLYTYNNITTSNIVVKGTSQIYALEMYSDGLKVNGGEYVRTKPDMEIRIKDKSGVNVNSFDTTDFKLFINNIYQPYNSRTSNGLVVEGSDVKTGGLTIRLSPTLPMGENMFKLVARKSNGIDFDTVKYSVFVSNQLLIKDFYNYPNPMKNQTGFIFNLGGNTPPSVCRIKVYTVSGRLVKIINSAANIGFNQINWDGRDNEGDYMANGVYFYRMTIEGDTKIESPIQKLVILK
jgi:hypothetical protein